MKKYFRTVKIELVAIVLLFFFNLQGRINTQPVAFKQHDHQIDVLLHGRLFTSYCYSDTLTKPILFPVYSPSGICVTRIFPMQKVAGESTDHPHHSGIFFCCDEVNGNNFWNAASPPPQIRHSQILQMSSDSTSGTISTLSTWNEQDNRSLLQERRVMKFFQAASASVIDVEIVLTALDQTVIFKDTKEGMFAIRVADWLKESGGTGTFVSSNNDSTEKGVWGKRAQWVALQGEKDGKKIGVVICHHAESINYPTFWHARAYGLFSANPVGQSVFQSSLGIRDPVPLNLTLKLGEEGLFKFRLVIYEGARNAKQIEQLLQTF